MNETETLTPAGIVGGETENGEMETAIQSLTPDSITPAIKSGVNAVLIARAYAETMRTEVNKVYAEILTECPVYADRWGETKQILNPDDLYLCGNEDLVADAYAEANVRLRKLGLKPAEMLDDNCPALVAETLLIDAQHVLVGAAEEVFQGITIDKLLCAGLDKYKQWIDLLCGLVISLPDFHNPLTGKA